VTSLLSDPVRRDRSPGIDCLRGAFALYVLFAHLVPWALTAQGTNTVFTGVIDRLIRVTQGHFETNPAVLGFIVLSGYCIHRNGLRADTFNLRGYAIRRAYRIVPVYLLGCAVGAILLGASSSAIAHALTATPDITFGGMLAKLSTVSAVVPSTYGPSFQGNAPLVTVAAEMWLYAFYAVMIKRTRILLPTVVVLWVAGLAYVSGHPQYLGWWHVGSFFGFLVYWWLGALFVNPSFVGRRPAVLAAAAAGWVVLSVVLDGHTGSLWVVEARKLALAVVIGGLIVSIDGVQHRLLAAGSVVGRAGYSIYALHAPIIVALLVAGVPWVICAVATVAIAMVVFVVYERPLLRKGARLAAESAGAQRADLPELRALTKV
jgi:peptidoglycan/LPS O-acetylase OafA/YrhL